MKVALAKMNKPNIIVLLFCIYIYHYNDYCVICQSLFKKSSTHLQPLIIKIVAIEITIINKKFLKELNANGRRMLKKLYKHAHINKQNNISKLMSLIIKIHPKIHALIFITAPFASIINYTVNSHIHLI